MNTLIQAVPMAGVNLSGGWSTFWGAVRPNVGGLMTLLTIAGMLIVLGAIFKYFWDKRRGGGGNTSGLMWSLLIGAILAGPDLFIPGILKIADLFINAVLSLLKVV